jgi:hypothetical protein
MTDISKDETKAQAVRDAAAQERRDKKQALLEREAREIPEWVVSPPKADEQGVYGVGIGSDADVLTSMRKARLQGTYELAKAMNAELSAEDTMTGSGEGQYRYIVSLFVNKVNVAGAEVVQQEVKPINGVFKTYVLVKLPFAEFNHALRAQVSSIQKTELEKDYERLMKRIAAPPAPASAVAPTVVAESGATRQASVAPEAPATRPVTEANDKHEQ